MVLSVGFALNQFSRAPFGWDSHSSVSLDAPIHCNPDDHSVSEDRGFEAASRPANSKAIVRRLQEWNDCWRRHLLHLKQQGPNSTQSLHKETVLCPVTEDSGSIKLEPVGAPLYHWAMYEGQGFGRVVSHTVEACLAAFVLQRPCLVNVSPRDPFYTWRSFVQAETYQWDPQAVNGIAHYGDQLENLAQELPTPGSNEWSRTDFNTTKFDSDLSLVFPMQRKFHKSNWTDAIQYYHTNNTENSRRPHQVLFSPNWGYAWFTRWPLAEIFKRQYHCNYETLKTEMQDAMYGLTDLSRRLHDSRYATASEKWSQSTSNEDEAQLVTPKDKELFGTIHLRMHFINENRKKPIGNGELVSMVRRCLKQASHEIGKSEFPKNWWLLADNAATAVGMAKVMETRQQAQLTDTDRTNPRFDDTFPIVNLYHDYTITNRSGKLLSSQHSNNAAPRGKFGHSHLAGAIEDWTALHQSKIAVVVHTGSFGTTGARGSSKTPRAYCGSASASAKDRGQYFQIYI